MNAVQVVFALMKEIAGLAKASEAAKLPVLVVEDREADAAMLQYCVRKCGYEPEWVETISDAKRRIKDQKYRLLILDVAFPNEDGLEFGNRVHFDYPELPVFIVTGTDVYFKRPDGDTIYRMPQGKRFSLCVKGSSGMALLDAIAEELRANGHAVAQRVDKHFALVMVLLWAMALATGYLWCLLDLKP